MKYTAIIVEPREHPALYYVLENALKNLSDEWSIIIFHGNKNVEIINTIISDRLSQYKERISLINLNIDNLTIQEYNNLFKYNTFFYEYIPTESFLVFQTDSIIFGKNKHLIDNFLKYDYVGAPWNSYRRNYECVGNGGFSLRKKSKMLEIMEKEGTNNYPEDLYFSCPKSVSIYKPNMIEATLFSVEEVFSPISFGCHKPWCPYLNENLKKLYDLYEEVRELYKYNNIEAPK